MAADQRDIIRIRTSHGKDEDMFLYRTTIGPDTARPFSYARYLARLQDHPEWYNALTRNCTRTLDKAISKEVANSQPWNTHILLNGKLDDLLYDRGRLVTDCLAFKDLRSGALINAIAKVGNKYPDFSAIIRYPY